VSSSSIAGFADAYAYEAVHSEADIFVTTKGEFLAELTEVDLPTLRLRCGRENLSRIFHFSVPAKRVLLYFLSGSSQPAIYVDGRELSAGEIMVCAPGTTHHDWTVAPCGWGSISLTADDLAAAGSAVLGRDLDLASVMDLVRPDPVHSSRLMNLHAAAERLARLKPNILARSEVARGLEQALIYAMIKSLSEGTSVEKSRGAEHHSRVIERFEALLAANRGHPLYLAEICVATGVSERTLRVCCNEHLGMGPIEYLRLRRMHLARRALVLADPTSSTVTQIATGLGFWELGRFSVEYRTLFGESPSVSLHHRSDRPKGTNSVPLPLPPRIQAKHVNCACRA
jgi:AraC-like DNA-binding protein